MILIAFLSS